MGSTLRLLTSIAFRPMFLLAVLHAIVVMAFWWVWWSGLMPVHLPGNPVYWHGHEMISGFIGAAIGGFMLTAVATWTNRPPVHGASLALLVLCWAGARLSPLLPLTAALFDFGYWTGLLVLMANEVLRAGNRRNYKILLLLIVFLMIDVAFHVAQKYYPQFERTVLWLQLWLVIMLINVIGGRIIPAFTRNWLLRKTEKNKTDNPSAKTLVLPSEFGAVDVMAIASLLVFSISSLLSLPVWWNLLIGTLTTVLQGWRLLRWQGHQTLSDPLIWMLHLSYAWIPIGIALMTLGLAAYIPVSAGIHALTIGAISSMIVSVSSRAALGHTGRPLQSHPILTLAVLLLTLAAVVRVAAAISGLAVLLDVAAIFWITAFSCFAFVYLPILFLSGKV